MALVDGVLEGDRMAPRKQRHTAHRIWCRIRAEMPEVKVAESTILAYVREGKIKLGLLQRETFIPLSYPAMPFGLLHRSLDRNPMSPLKHPAALDNNHLPKTESIPTSWPVGSSTLVVGSAFQNPCCGTDLAQGRHICCCWKDRKLSGYLLRVALFMLLSIVSTAVSSPITELIIR
jgi:hypothetical protein